jgi:hypothetical protein
MTKETHFVIEVRQVHLHAVGRDTDVSPEVWSDALYEFLPDSPNQSVHCDADGARDVARLLRDVAGVPVEDIRITQVSRTPVPMEADEADASSAGEIQRLYRWYSEALRRYGCGHAFALGRTLDEARSAAMLAFRSHLASDDWWGTGPEADGSFRFEDDREEYEAAVMKFQADIDADPFAVGEAFIVLGSE